MMHVYVGGGVYFLNIMGGYVPPPPPATPEFWQLEGASGGLFELENGLGVFELEQVSSLKNKIRVTVRLK